MYIICFISNWVERICISNGFSPLKILYTYCIFFDQVKAGEQDLNQPSILILPFIGLLVLAFLNKEKVLDVVSGFAGVISEKVANAAAQSKQNSAKNVQSVLDDSQIDQLVQNINAVKKRPKLRKVWTIPSVCFRIWTLLYRVNVTYFYYKSYI